MAADPKTAGPPTRAEVTARLAAELQRRLWALFDAARAVAADCNATPEQWETFFRAVADVPASQRPKDASDAR